MNSSGIKRGLAVSAISALAVAGIPALASPANAATSDINSLVSSGPARNGLGLGSVVVLKVVPGAVTTANLRVTSTGLGPVGSEDNATQTVGNPTNATVVANGAAGDSNPTDGLDEITVRVPVTTSTDGATASYAIFEDENTDGAVQATESRVQVTTTTAGAPTNLAITPASQTAPQGVTSGAYTVTVRDAGGRATQLVGAEVVNITDNSATTTTSDTQITAGEAPNGTSSFTAVGTAKGLTTISASGAGGITTNTATATLDVVGAATISDAELDIVTAADSWDGLGDSQNPVSVRVDQSTIRLDFVSNDIPADANGTVQLTLTGSGGVTFGGKTSTVVTTTLNAQGTGSITITPDAGTVNDASSISVVGSGLNKDLNFDRATFASVVADSSTYVSAFKGSVNVTVTAQDQFGLPFTSGQLDAQRVGGANADAAPSQRKAIGADGKVTFTFTDTKATELSKTPDQVNVGYYTDAFDASRDNLGNVAQIVYTADGLGADYTVTANGVNTSGAAYDPTTVSTSPLADAVANSPAERIDLAIAGGTPGVDFTVTADGGALVLNRTDGDITLEDAAASKTGDSTDQFSIIGTKTGPVTVTVTSAGRTKTFTVTIKAPVGPARNISLSGPAEAEAGKLAVFTATITDAFGNPVPNFDTQAIGNALNVQVSGPAQFQDTSRITDANGQVVLNVRLNADARSPITVTVTATNQLTSNSQFGFTADDADAIDDDTNPGLPASVNVASATVSDVQGPVVGPGPVATRINVNTFTGQANGGKSDKIRINVTGKQAPVNATATLFKRVNGRDIKLRAKDFSGRAAQFVVRDLNKKKLTLYFVKVSRSDTTLPATGPVKKVR